MCPWIVETRLCNMLSLTYLLLSWLLATSYAAPQVKLNDTTIIGVEFNVLNVAQEFFGGQNSLFTFVIVTQRVFRDTVCARAAFRTSCAQAID